MRNQNRSTFSKAIPNLGCQLSQFGSAAAELVQIPNGRGVVYPHVHHLALETYWTAVQKVLDRHHFLEVDVLLGHRGREVTSPAPKLAAGCRDPRSPAEVARIRARRQRRFWRVDVSAVEILHAPQPPGDVVDGRLRYWRLLIPAALQCC